MKRKYLNKKLISMSKIRISLLFLVSFAAAFGGIYSFSKEDNAPGKIQVLSAQDAETFAPREDDASQIALVKGESTATPVNLATSPLLDLEWKDVAARNSKDYSNGDFVIQGNLLRIASEAVTSAAIRWHAIEGTDLGKNSVTSRVIKDGSIDSRDLAHSLSIDKLSIQDALITESQNAFQINPYGDAAGNTGELRLFELEANGENYVGLKSPDAITTDTIWTLPSADGSANQILATNGSGILSWSSVAAGSVAANSLDFAQLSDTLSLDAATSIDIGSLALITSGTGTVSFNNTGAFTVAGALNLSGNALTSADALTITPAATKNLNVTLSGTGDFAVNTNHLYVDTSAAFVGIGTAAPARKLEILEANSAPQLRLSKSGSVYTDVTVDSAGDMKFATTGGDIRAMSENLWICDNDGCPTITTPILTGQGNVVVENAEVFGNNFSVKQINSTTLGTYDSGGNLVMTFDEQ